MTGIDETIESQGNILCKSCGLCCTGHLFIWTKLRSAELDPAKALGLKVIRSDPRQRGFSQPCPLWDGHCTIYSSPHYPHFCRTYKCKLLKGLLNENISLSNALTVIEQAKALIHEVETLLPASTQANFRERLVAELEAPKDSTEQRDVDVELRRKAEALLSFYEQVFGVDDLLDKPDEY